MDFLRMTIEDEEVIEDHQIDTVAFSLYRFHPDYEWVVNLNGTYYTFFEFGESKSNKEAVMLFSGVYEKQIQHFRQYYYSLGISVAGLLLMGNAASTQIDQIVESLSEQKCCELPELAAAKQTIAQEIHDTKAKLSTEYLPYMLDYVKLIKHDERFFLLGLFVCGMEKRLFLQKRFFSRFMENGELIKKLYAPLLEEKKIISDLQHNHQWLLPA